MIAVLEPDKIADKGHMLGIRAVPGFVPGEFLGLARPSQGLDIHEPKAMTPTVGDW